MYGETSAYILSNTSISGIKNSQSEYDNKTVALQKMIAWFNDHANQLPKTMQINKSAFTPDLVLTIESCIMQAKQNLGNYKMEGSFLLLRQIRANIEKGENDLL